MVPRRRRHRQTAAPRPSTTTLTTATGDPPVAGTIARSVVPTRKGGSGERQTGQPMGSNAVPTLVVIATVAVAAPIISELLRRYIELPEVVIQIVLGIVVGPYVLAIVHPDAIVTALSDLGLTFLMFLAGAELDPAILKEGRAGLAVTSWLASLAIAVALGAALHATGLVIDTVVAGAVPDDHRAGHLAPHAARCRGTSLLGRADHPLGRCDRRVRPHRRRRASPDEPERRRHPPPPRTLRRGRRRGRDCSPPRSTRLASSVCSGGT